MKKNLPETLRHIQNVQRNALLMAENILKSYGNAADGREEFPYQLMQLGMKHDNSKLAGYELDHLHHQDPRFEAAKKIHYSRNPHHPEFWENGIKEMTSVYVAEMVCDWAARAQEFGTSFYDWVDNHATKRFGFTKEDEVYREIMYFASMLYGEPFKR